MPDAQSTFWRELRERCEQLDPGARMVTPISNRRFRIEATFDERIDIRFQDSDEDRSLWRAQFEMLADRIDDESIPLAGLPPGVEPYVTVLSLVPGFGADDETFFRTDEPGDGESPYLVTPVAARSRPERVHDDALLLADMLERADANAPRSLDTETLADLYVLLSDVQHGSDRVRRSTTGPLLDRIGPGQNLRGRFGTVRRTTRERRRPKDEDTVLAALDEHGIPHEWVLGIDQDKLDVVIAATELSESEVIDVSKQVYIQKTGVDEDEKYSRLQGLVDRIDDLARAEREAVQEELEELESRLDEALSAE